LSCASDPDSSATVRDIGGLASRNSGVTGTPEQIAAQLVQSQAVGVDGINVINATIPGSYNEFIDYVMPELRRRGLARVGYEPGTHRAARYRGAFG
jgi:long-chain alkane monooxygenase